MIHKIKKELRENYKPALVVLLPLVPTWYFQILSIYLGFLILIVPLGALGLLKERLANQEYLKGMVGYLSVIMVVIIYFAGIYIDQGLVIEGTEIKGDVYNSIYFSIVTFTTLGYGDIHPTEGVRLWASLEALIGYMHLGILTAVAFKWVNSTPKKDLSNG